MTGDIDRWPKRARRSVVVIEVRQNSHITTTSVRPEFEADRDARVTCLTIR